MESLLVLVGLIVLAIPVTIIVLLVGQARLRGRVEQLELQIAKLSPGAEAEEQAPIPERPAPQQPTEKSEVRPAPWSPPKAQRAEGSQVEPASEPKDTTPAIVFRHDRFAALGAWLRENWGNVGVRSTLDPSPVFFADQGLRA